MGILLRVALPKLTFARVIGGVVVLVLVSTGTAYAANEWTGVNIVNGSLTSADIADYNLGSIDIRDGALRTADVSPHAMTGAAIKESTLWKFSRQTSSTASTPTRSLEWPASTARDQTGSSTPPWSSGPFPPKPRRKGSSFCEASPAVPARREPPRYRALRT